MFEAFDAVFLARLQFAFTVSFHFIFPSFSIGLASFLAVLEGLWLWTGRQVYLDLFKYWLKIFALAFGMGVVSGIVMSYQFGTNWSVFSDKAGPVLGPLMAYEVLTAFFLEAGFLGVMLFGMNRVGKGLHFAATLAVAGGTFFSAFWILAANSWMQTPAGYAINAGGQFVPVDWWAIIFNPSFPYRLVHTVFGAYLTTALVVGAVAAWHLLRGRFDKSANSEGVRVMFSMAMGMITVVAPLQIFAGDQHGLNTLEHQPVKVMAMEGHFKSYPDGAPLVLFGWPDEAAGKTLFAVEIPKASSLILKHSWDAPPEGTRHGRPQGLAAGGCRVLGVPDHGRHGHADARPGGVQPARARARETLRLAAAASPGARDGAGRLRRRHRGLGDDGSRTPAPTRCTACCARPTRRRLSMRRPWALRSWPSSSSTSSPSAPAPTTS